MADATHEFDYKKHVRSYLVVFAALFGLTILTVIVGYIELPMPLAVTVAMIIALVKGGLVAAVFMHLMSERKVIYWILGLTAFFFVVLLTWPAIDEALGMGGHSEFAHPPAIDAPVEHH